MGYEVFDMLCKEKGVTAYQVAKETGVSTATLSSWKTGRYNPKDEKLQKIADYFGVRSQYLRTGDIRDKYLPDINTFMESLKTSERFIEKQNQEFTYKFSRLNSKDREEIMRIIDMKIEMSKEKENENLA